MDRFFLIVALHERFSPRLEDRALSDDEILFQQTVHTKVSANPDIRITVKLADAFLLASDKEHPLIRIRNAFALHRYFLQGGDAEWGQSVLNNWASVITPLNASTKNAPK